MRWKKYEVETVDFPPYVVKPMNEDMRREATLKLAKQIYSEGGLNKTEAARLAIKVDGIWKVIAMQSAIDFIRQRLP